MTSPVPPPLQESKVLSGASASNRVRWLAAAVLLAAAVGLLDYAAGYELRLGILYLLPIALATWAAGRNAGFSIAALACLGWLLSSYSSHNYSRALFLYWDGIVLAATFVVFVVLLARLHQALTRADERFVRLIGEMRAGVYVVDPASDTIRYANQRLAQILDADPLAMSGSELQTYFSGSETVGGSSQEAAAAVSASPGFTSRERRNPSTGRWYLVQSGQIPWQGGRSAVLKVITDITDRRHAQFLRRENQDMLNRTARLSELAEATSALAHEINQPLMAIASYNDACLRLFSSETPDREEMRQALEKSRAQAIRAGDIVTRMRDAVRNKNPKPVLCDLNEIVREALGLMETRIDDDCVVANIMLAEQIPPVLADRFLLVQVVVNLLENAVDAMRSSNQANRRLTVSTDHQADGMIGVSIADHGEGISAAIGEHLYTPFLSTKPHGLGLGLSICRSVVEAHGGRLWHSPNPGGGTIFYFTVAAEAS